MYLTGSEIEVLKIWIYREIYKFIRPECGKAERNRNIKKAKNTLPY